MKIPLREDDLIALTGAIEFDLEALLAAVEPLNQSTRDWYTQAATLHGSAAAICATAAVIAGSS
jgi:hypothetical protein